MLPGSRTQEVTRNLPIMIRAAERLAGMRPGVRFAVACLHERHRSAGPKTITRPMLDVAGLDLTVHAAKTPELIRSATVAWAVSGSVGLELMLEALPTVVLYKVRRFDLWVARHFIRAKYISLVNLLADAEVFPEYLTPVDVSAELAGWADRWLARPELREESVRALIGLRDRVARPGACERAAERIVEIASRPKIPPPHFGHGVGSRAEATRVIEVTDRDREQPRPRGGLSRG